MHAKERRFGIKQLVLLLSVVALLVGAVTATYAYLKSQTTTVTNEFVPVKVTCQVEETFDGNVKKDVCVRNTGDINAFLRATLIINWVDADGNVLSTAPVEGADYTITWGSTAWQQGADGFWYYTKAVAPNGTTANLINSLMSHTTLNGYRLQVQILATAIQADPPKAALTAWGATVNGQTLTPP